VGGAGILPMKELVGILESLEFRDIRTYIQSGNVVFTSPEDDPSRVVNRIRAEIGKRFGFEPQILLMEPGELKQKMEGNPFPEAESEPKTLHLFFLQSVPEDPDIQAAEQLKRDSERYALGDNVFYLHAPEGIGRSKLAAKLEKLLGVPVTGRNWRTVTGIMALAENS
jgi:uncharacterized protein (DUF1697 family)